MGQHQQLLRSQRLAERPGPTRDRPRGSPERAPDRGRSGTPRRSSRGARHKRRRTRGAGARRRGRSWQSPLRSKRLASGSIGLVRPRPAGSGEDPAVGPGGRSPSSRARIPPCRSASRDSPPSCTPAWSRRRSSRCGTRPARGRRSGRPRPRTGIPDPPSGPRPTSGRRRSAGPRLLRQRPPSDRRA